MERADFIRLARAGAEARLAMLERERAAIMQLFPDLKEGRSVARRKQSEPAAIASAADSGSAPVASRGISVPRTDLSAAARRAISRAQKKRWAAWRKARAAKAR
jgi:hypothetical protein